MDTYISDTFLNHINFICEKIRNGYPTEEISNLQALKELLLSSRIHFYVNDPCINKILDNYNNRKDYKNYAELLIINAIKKGVLKPENIEFNTPHDRHAFYFLSQQLAKLFESQYGVIAKGEEFSGSDYFQNLSVADLALQNNYEILRKRAHSCNSMIILDKYIFSSPFKTKAANLIKFIHLFKKEAVSDFQLTIIYSQIVNGRVIIRNSDLNTVFRELQKIKGLYFELLANNYKSIDDRIILTNYSSINIGHPFDDRPTRYNQQFYAYGHTSDSIKENYNNYIQTIREVKKLVASLKERNKTTEIRVANSEFINRIFTRTTD